MLGKLDLTFWQILQMINASNPAKVLERSGNGSAGLYGFAAVAAPLGRSSTTSAGPGGQF